VQQSCLARARRAGHQQLAAAADTEGDGDGVGFGDDAVGAHQQVRCGCGSNRRLRKQGLQRRRGVFSSVEFGAVASDVPEHLARDEYRDEGTLQRDPAIQQSEADHHRHQPDADAAEELGDQRGFEGHSNRAHHRSVLGVGDGRYLIGPVGNGAERAQFWRMVQQLELAPFEQGAARVVLSGELGAALAGASV
jgi:hypothetical protein